MPIICIDGPNGAGKTTQAGLLSERLIAEIPGVSTFLLSDPGVCEGNDANQIRVLARTGKWKHELTRAMLFLSARCELVAEIDEIVRTDPTAWVILDRYTPSFCVYQLSDFLMACDGDMSMAIQTINMLHTTIGAHTPDLTFILDVDPSVGIKRYTAAAHDQLDVFEKDIEKIYALYHRYKQLVECWPSFACLGDMFNIEVEELSAKAVHEKLWVRLDSAFSEKDVNV